MKQKSFYTIVKKTAIFFILFCSINYCEYSKQYYEQMEFSNCSLYPIHSEIKAISLYNNSKSPQIFISTFNKQKVENTQGKIYSFDINRQKIKEMQRIPNSKKNSFDPFNLYTKTIAGDTYLYVISRKEQKFFAKNINSNNKIFIYKLQNDHSLHLVKHFHNHFFFSPNSIYVLEDGSFYITNDKKETYLNNLLYNKKYSNIVYCKANHHYAPASAQKVLTITSKTDFSCSIVAIGLDFANGIVAQNNKLYVTDSIKNRVYQFTIGTKNQSTLVDPIVLSKIKHPNNLYIYNNSLIVSSHFSPISFVLHLLSKKLTSPIKIYRIPLKNLESTSNKNIYHEKKLIFYDSGKLISAVSGEIVYKNNLYLSQLFGSNLLQCRIRE